MEVQSHEMKRFLFLSCGAALVILAGWRYVIILADVALSSNKFFATARIQFSANTPLPEVADGFSSKNIVSLTTSAHFRELLRGTTEFGMALSQREAVEQIEKFTTLKTDTANRQMLVTTYGSNAESVTDVAYALARTWLEQNAPGEMVLPVQPAKVVRPSVWAYIRVVPFLLMVCGGVIFLIGWRMPRTAFTQTAPITVIAAKY